MSFPLMYKYINVIVEINNNSNNNTNNKYLFVCLHVSVFDFDKLDNR